MSWKCRYAPSLGALESTPEEIWGTEEYEMDLDEPTIFFGLYGLPDFYTLWRHRGKKAILWAGSDIKHFINGYWLDNEGRIRIDPQALAEWINKNCESYVENGVEHEALMVYNIESKILPSYLGKLEKGLSYTPSERPAVYMSVSGDNFEMYGWNTIEQIADKCEVDFYLYGNTIPFETKHSNVFVRGRIPKEKMNEEIKNMQAGLRTLEFDGFSEILAKSILWGQHPISYIAYPHIDSYKSVDELIKLLNNLKNKSMPNLLGREYYIKNLNNYPWNENKNNETE